MMYFNLPKRMINITKLVCVIGVVSVAFSSCLQKDVYDPANSGDKEEEVTLDNYFDFATTKNIQLNIDYGKECPRAYFEVYAENPLSYVAEGGQIIKKAGVSHIATGFTDIQGRYIKPASFPTAVSEVYIYSPDFGVPTLYKTKVVGSDVSAKITFENALDVTPVDSSTRSAQTRSSLKFITNVIPNVLGTWNVNTGRPNYLDASKKINVDATLKSYITTYFPEGKNNVGTNLVSDDADILIKEDANVVVNYFGGDTGAQSVFAYYCYSENASIDEIRQAAKHACVIFPNAHKSSLGNYSGVAVNLKYINETGSFPEEEPERIPAGTKIGFLIWNDGWRGVKANGNMFYSTKSLNSDKISHTAIFAAKNKVGERVNVITMEDWKNGENDYNDVAFVISSNPIAAIEVPDVPNPGDRQGTEKYSGVLGFEDNWPEQGDYDLNDVVMKYQSSVDYNIDNKVLNIIDKFTLAWTGANYKNSFAYEVPFDLSKASKVTVNGSETSSYSGNVITLFKDAKAELGVSNVNAEDMINQNIQEKTYTVSIQFNNPTLDKSVVVAPYNPFIKVFNSATEVHLTDHKPTTGANNRFPSGADISRGDVDGTYFICKDGFPFAIHVDARLDASILNLDLKKENQRIDKTYPKFAEWAKTRDPQIKWWK
ncbi:MULTISPECIES: LruC domain-containing protein [Bacteroides]|uniref:LruC domain-containing protein n=2 Tax=Bacteria TaxID=2 RepID=A0A1Y4UZA6_9BACE|nr:MULTISPECIES: LruC domain-containing protein [Bacteroides]OUQ63187.1 LruC domain-containing protein [Bacteroides xylanisolvens]RGI98656.1 LruC domain-containing protein [Bacteroides xylanisolvens]RGK59089.1 LruC domain-containing protein [Bacteroides xylanisolvens]RHK92038.1 LruC domain-containing protein [Bacteroides xylanisolvens]UVQ11045.1 LruC domain-containing protein [Bacteroides xylanisolvens]